MSGSDTPGARERAGEAFTAWESTLSSALWQHGVQVGEAEELATTAIAAIEGARALITDKPPTTTARTTTAQTGSA